MKLKILFLFFLLIAVVSQTMAQRGGRGGGGRGGGMRGGEYPRDLDEICDCENEFGGGISN